MSKKQKLDTGKSSILFNEPRLLGIEHLFGSVTRTRILRTFLNNSNQQFFMRELSRKINIQLNAVRREVANLEQLGLLTAAGSGYKKFYKLNDTNILFPELKALIAKSQFLIEQKILQKIDGLGKLDLLLLSGKFVNQNNASVDMLVVGRINRDNLKEEISKLQVELGWEINYTLMSGKEYLYRLEVGDKFLYHLLEARRIILADKMQAKLL